MDGVAVVKAEVLLIHGAAVDLHRAVVRPQIPAARQLRRQLHAAGDLLRRKPLIREQKRLVVDPAVGRGGVAHEVVSLRMAGDVAVRPVVRLKDDVRAVAPAHERVREIARPRGAVAHLRAADGVEVVERPVAQLRHPESAVGGEVVDHLRRGLGLRREHEGNVQPVDRERAVALDIDRRARERGMSGRVCQADAG